MLTPNEQAINAAIRNVRTKTWGEWRDLFEHNGPISMNPVLADPERFKDFCFKWGVGRTIRSGTHDQLRRTLRDSSEFADAICDVTGRKLTEMEKELRGQFATRQGKSAIVSVVSKIAAFLRPDRFVAWDRYARRGLNIVLERPAGKPFKNYAEYLADFDKVWEGQVGERIREVLGQTPNEPLETEPRFQRRVLDLYLLEIGRQKAP